MGLKQLLIGRLGAALLAILAALHAFANPIDTDNDGVFDEDDQCPTVKGSPCFDGCPGPPGEECVVARGTNYTSGIVTCPDGSLTVGYWRCNDYDSGWGIFRVAIFSSSGTYSHTVELADEDGDGVLDEDDRCKDDDGDKDFYGCEPRTYCTEMDDNFESKCYQWVFKNMDALEWHGYYTQLEAFAEGGCDGQPSHGYAAATAGTLIMSPRLTGNGSISTNLPTGLPPGPIVPPITSPVSPAGIDGLGHLYTGQCQNQCKTILISAGLLSLGATNIPAVVASVAGKRILNGVGITLIGEQLINLCEAEMWLDGTYD